MSQWHGRCSGCGMYYGPMTLASGAVLRCPKCGWIVKEVGNGPGQTPTGGTATNPGVGAVAGAAAGQGADPEQGTGPCLAIDALGPLDGWRAWRAPAGEGTLHSIWATARWEPGKNTARCLRNQMMASGYLTSAEPSPPHDVPSPIGSAHRCGFYACLGPDFEAMNGESPISFREAVSVFGRVELWGRVYTYEKGYRAQYARITALVRLWKPEHEEAMAALAERYGVPIEDPPVGLATWVREAAEHNDVISRANFASARQWVTQTSPTTTTAYWPPLEEPKRPAWKTFLRILGLFFIGYGGTLLLWVLTR